MTKQMTATVLFFLSGAGLIVACCPTNPLPNSAIAAHGDTDWHRDTAEEFLFGTNMGGNVTAANHCPVSWKRLHIHEGLTKTNHFYYDSDFFTPGDDTSSKNGIDQAMLFFYAGHGWPTSWNTLGNSATQGNMSLGDCPGNGRLRYYWQCSCQVFAHGPMNCSGSSYDYSCPQEFDGSSDSEAMRNVYERWGPALAPALRLACGASTDALCFSNQTDRIWNNYNNNGLDVADSFIDGISEDNWVVPLCITTGVSDVSNTPLFDSTFTVDPNPSGPYYHIQYLSEFASTGPRIIVTEPPEELPILELIRRPWPEPPEDPKLVKQGELLVSEEQVKERGPRMRIHTASGAIYVRGERDLDLRMPVLSEKEYLNHAQKLIAKLGWDEEEMAELQGRSFRIVTRPREQDKSDATSSQKNVLFRARRIIQWGDQIIPVYGEGGQVMLQLNNDGSLLNAAKVWRPVKGTRRMARVKRFEMAYKEALEGLEDATGYELRDWFWGYNEAAGNVQQGELRVFYRFEFGPRSRELLLRFPPRLVEIPGQVD